MVLFLTTVKGQTEVKIRVPKNKVYNLTAVTISGLKAIAGNVVSIHHTKSMKLIN